MERIVSRQPIAEALGLIPPGLRRRVEHAHFMTGTDPGFVGLLEADALVGKGYVLSECLAVCAYDFAQTRPRSSRHTTVVLLGDEQHTIATILHELGHVLDQNIGWGRHNPDPVSAYAADTVYELFAEAFVCYVSPEIAATNPDVGGWAYDLDAARADRQTVALFDALSV